MSRTVHTLDHDGNATDGPLVGALLRRPFLAARSHAVNALHDAGFDDIQPAHLAVFQYPGPDGRSPGDIARGAGTTKQAMNNLLTQLERTGYVERVPHPDNRRERIVHLTARGRASVEIIRTAMRTLEQSWCDELGDHRYERLRSGLQLLNDKLAGTGPS